MSMKSEYENKIIKLDGEVKKYKGMWRREGGNVVKLQNAYLRLKDLMNEFIGIHNEQGKLIMELVEDKITLDEFKTRVKDKLAKSEEQAKTVKKVEAPEVEKVEAVEAEESK